MCNMTEVKLREHSDSKHPKNSFADCFPTFVSLGGERGGQSVACSLLVTTWSACCAAEDGPSPVHCLDTPAAHPLLRCPIHAPGQVSLRWRLEPAASLNEYETGPFMNVCPSQRTGTSPIHAR